MIFHSPDFIVFFVVVTALYWALPHRGQNVLFTDLHVGWHNTRRLGPHDQDMFLNNEQQPGPGLGVLDAVLLPSVFPFVK